MDAQELRIGNLVEIDGSVLELNRKRFEYAVCKDCCLGIKPIPLTEEWFLKFGFQFDTIDWQFPKNSVYFIGWYAGKWRLGTHSDGVLKETYFEYVHQLQNLYFALTGEELNIKN